MSKKRLLKAAIGTLATYTACAIFIFGIFPLVPPEVWRKGMEIVVGILLFVGITAVITYFFYDQFKD